MKKLLLVVLRNGEKKYYKNLDVYQISHHDFNNMLYCQVIKKEK